MTTPDVDFAEYMEEWKALIEDMAPEDVAVIYGFLTELRDLPPAARSAKIADMHERVRRMNLTPEAARAAIVAELEAGREPDGALLGDWLSVDPALQAFFKFTYQTMNAPDTVLHLAPQGFVLSA